jgi:glycosyltransferase involved in cell wall biosynthesis
MLPVSIVVPVRNESRSLPELLEAIANQDAKPLEVVFVDTGSSDDSAHLVEGWMEAAACCGIKCQLLRLPNGYPGAARNAGVRVATQEWIAFIDAGIVPAGNWLSALWACQQKCNRPAIYGVCRFVSDEALGKILCALSYGYARVRPVLPASLFRRDLFDKVAFFEPGLRAGEDILWQRALDAAGISTEICRDARVEYRHFPGTLQHAARKWFTYEQSVTVAGVGGGLRMAVQFAVLFMCGWLIIDPATGVFGLAVYALSRGILDPLRRSGWRPWWGTRFWAVFAAVPVAALIDVSSAAGRVASILRGGRLGRT